MRGRLSSFQGKEVSGHPRGQWGSDASAASGAVYRKTNVLGVKNGEGKAAVNELLHIPSMRHNTH